MSISPQSLARTRDKRSLRIPARFDDFSDIPSEVALRSALENSKRNRAQTRQSTSSSGMSDSPEPTPSNSRRQTAAKSTHKTTPAPGAKKRESPESPDIGEIADEVPQLEIETQQVSKPSSDVAPSENVLRKALEGPIPVPAQSKQSTAISDLPESPSSEESPPKPTASLVDEPQEISVPQPSTSKQDSPPPTGNISAPEDVIATPTTKQSAQHRPQGPIHAKAIMGPCNPKKLTLDEVSPPVDDGDSSGSETPRENSEAIKTESRENIEAEDRPPRVISSLESALRDPLITNVTRKSPFHPSISISNASKTALAKAKPTGVKRPSQDPVESPVTQQSTSSPTKSRKKVKGHSLIKQAKEKPAKGTRIIQMYPVPNKPGYYQTLVSGDTTNGYSIDDIDERPTQRSTSQIIDSNLTKTYSGITNPAHSNFGSTYTGNNAQRQAMYQNASHMRLLVNEGLYLPTSVASIQPITATLPAISNLARKPPFISKKAEAYINYQNDRKMDFLLSTNRALTKIARYVDVKDLLNLREVSKTWRTIIDCQDVWNTFVLKGTDNIAPSKYKDNIWKRFRTKKLILEERQDYTDQFGVKNIADALAKTWIEEFTIISSRPESHRYAFDLIEVLIRHPEAVNRVDKWPHLKHVIWKAGVTIDDFGIAKLDIKQGEGDAYSRNLYVRDLDGSGVAQVEASMLEELFNDIQKPHLDALPVTMKLQ